MRRRVLESSNTVTTQPAQIDSNPMRAVHQTSDISVPSMCTQQTGGGHSISSIGRAQCTSDPILCVAADGGCSEPRTSLASGQAQRFTTSTTLSTRITPVSPSCVSQHHILCHRLSVTSLLSMLYGEYGASSPTAMCLAVSNSSPSIIPYHRQSQ